MLINPIVELRGDTMSEMLELYNIDRCTKLSTKTGSYEWYVYFKDVNYHENNEQSFIVNLVQWHAKSQLWALRKMSIE